MDSLFSSRSHWIWQKGAAESNCYLEFRAEFSLSEISEARLHISAEGQYAAFLNGKWIISSQYSDYPAFKAVQCPEVAPLLKEGENALVIQVWYAGKDSSVYRKEEPGLRFELRAGGEVICTSGADTQVRPLAGYVQGEHVNITPQLGAGFTYQRQEPAEWTNADAVEKSAQLVRRPISELEVFENSGAKILSQGVFRLSGGADAGERLQYAGLYFRELSDLTAGSEKTFPSERGIHFYSEEQDGIYLLLDLGALTVGYLALDIVTPEPSKIDIGFGEHLDDLRVRTSVGGRCFTVTACADAKRERFVHRFRRLGCRYLQIFIHSKEATVFEAGLLPVQYPLNLSPSFSCADRLHEEIYKVSVQTLRACLHEHYEDCPWREQALYAFDSRNQMLAGYYAFGEFTVPRESLRLLALSQREDGLLELCAPARVPVNIPSFSLAFIAELEEYCRYSGDIAFACEMLPVAEKILESFRGQMKDGLAWNYREAGYWNFYEWSPLLDATPLDRSQTLPPSAEAGLQLFGLLALQRMADIYGYLGLEKAELERECAGVSQGLEGFWSEKEGAYASFLREGKKVQYAELIQALALYTGACPPERRERLRQGLLEKRWLPITLSYSVFKYEALLQAPELYAKPVFDEIAERWGKMLFKGATTFWETDLGAEDFDRAGSLCHGWSGIPVYLYGAYVLGVKPESPGVWSRKEPCFAGIHEPHGKFITPTGIFEY